MPPDRGDGVPDGRSGCSSPAVHGPDCGAAAGGLRGVGKPDAWRHRSCRGRGVCPAALAAHELKSGRRDREISAPVLAAVERVDRHRFVRPENVDEAYENRPLPIGEGQTISQPLIVAMMTEALGISPGDRVLEVGTGSGYQAAVLAEMGVKVYSLEIIPALARVVRGKPARGGLRRRRAAHGRRVFRLGGRGALRWDHRDGCSRSRAAAADPAAAKRAVG